MSVLQCYSKDFVSIKEQKRIYFKNHTPKIQQIRLSDFKSQVVLVKDSFDDNLVPVFEYIIALSIYWMSDDFSQYLPFDKVRIFRDRAEEALRKKIDIDCNKNLRNVIYKCMAALSCSVKIFCKSSYVGMSKLDIDFTTYCVALEICSCFRINTPKVINTIDRIFLIKCAIQMKTKNISMIDSDSLNSRVKIYVQKLII